MNDTELIKQIGRMVDATKKGKLKWNVLVQTTETNEEKYYIEEDGRNWQVDECYVSYVCNFQGKDFCMITYELMRKSKGEFHTSNFVFLPPMGIRLFHVHTLLPYSVQNSNMLSSAVHMLWLILLEMAKQKNENVQFDVVEGKVTIEEDARGQVENA